VCSKITSVDGISLRKKTKKEGLVRVQKERVGSGRPGEKKKKKVELGRQRGANKKSRVEICRGKKEPGVSGLEKIMEEKGEDKGVAF